MKRKILIAVMAILPCFVFAQSSDPNIGIGLGDPIFGINLKINFPGLTGGWSRGYSISNHDRSKQFIMFGTMGSANNGISTQSYSFIGQDWYNAYMVFRPDGNIGIGTTEVENSEGWNRVLQVKGEFHAKSNNNGCLVAQYGVLWGSCGRSIGNSFRSSCECHDQFLNKNDDSS